MRRSFGHLLERFGPIAAALEGKDGKLTVWQHRAGFVRAMGALADAPGKSKAMQELATGIAGFLMDAWGEKASEIAFFHRDFARFHG